MAGLGFKPGGSAIYGLRRQLLDTDGMPKQILGFGERKSLLTERVIYVPGPVEECEIVRSIFREFVEERRSLTGIANRLNTDGTPYVMGRRCNMLRKTNIINQRLSMPTPSPSTYRFSSATGTSRLISINSALPLGAQQPHLAAPSPAE